jgi:phage shock protein A
MSENSAFDAFSRMEERIEQNERQIKASAEIEEEFSGDALQQSFKALEYKGSSDQQLLELKARMGLLAPGQGQQTRQLNKGAGDEVHEAEVVDEGDGESGRG